MMLNHVPEKSDQHSTPLITSRKFMTQLPLSIATSFNENVSHYSGSGQPHGQVLCLLDPQGVHQLLEAEENKREEQMHIHDNCVQ